MKYTKNRSVFDRLRDFLDYRVPSHMPIKQVRSRLTRPVASFTFDDFPRSALLHGAAVLEEYGATGTFYAAGALAGTSDEGLAYYQPSDLADLIHRGHEIGDHSFGHMHVPRLDRSTRDKDRARNANFLSHASPGLIATSFAYPFGHTSIASKRYYGRHFACCRGTSPGINAGSIDLAQLKAISLEAAVYDPARLDPLLQEAKAAPGWLIFYTHDVQDNPTAFGTATTTFASVVRACHDAGIEILPVRNALARACFA